MSISFCKRLTVARRFAIGRSLLFAPRNDDDEEGDEDYDNDGLHAHTDCTAVEKWSGAPAGCLLLRHSVIHGLATPKILCSCGHMWCMVALALMELGMRYEDAVELIRQKRRGAINAKQLSYLASYRPKCRLRVRGSQNKCCVQ